MSEMEIVSLSSHLQISLMLTGSLLFEITNLNFEHKLLLNSSTVLCNLQLKSTVTGQSQRRHHVSRHWPVQTHLFCLKLLLLFLKTTINCSCFIWEINSPTEDEHKTKHAKHVSSHKMENKTQIMTHRQTEAMICGIFPLLPEI